MLKSASSNKSALMAHERGPSSEEQKRDGEIAGSAVCGIDACFARNGDVDGDLFSSIAR
jgi:hypothetical protein